MTGDIDTEPSVSCDVELDDKTIGKPLSSPPIIRVPQEPADWKQAWHSYAESLMPAQYFSVYHARTGEPYMNFGR